MYHVDYTKTFKKDLKRCEKRGLNLLKIFDAIKLLEATGSLPPSYHPHKLKGNKDGQWECHIEPDCLMIWEQNYDIYSIVFRNRDSFRFVLNNNSQLSTQLPIVGVFR